MELRTGKLALALLCASAFISRAADDATGRWEGKIKIPGQEFSVIVDLGQESAGNWSGSITIPGLNLKGAPLTEITLKKSEIIFTIKGAFAAPDSAPTKIQGRFSGASFHGNFLQGGNSAPMSMQKTGPPQVEPVAHSTAITPEVEGEWKGEYEFLGYKRKVTLKLANRAGAGATADFVVVGRRVNNLPVDLVTLEGNFLTVDSHETGLSYEGRFVKNTKELNGVIIQGGLEAPLTLHRQEKETP